MFHENTKMYIKSLDFEVELRLISLDDLEYIYGLLSEPISDEDFARKVLFHQLVLPELDYQELLNVSSEDLISLGKSFIENNPSTFEYYDDSASFYKEFKRAIVLEIKNFSTSIESSLKAIEKTLQKALEVIVVEPYSADSFLREISQALSQMARVINQNLVEDLSQLSSSIASLSNQIIENFRQQWLDLDNWIENNKIIFNSYFSYWDDFSKRYDITEARAARVLKKYKWFITPSLPISLLFDIVKIDERGGRQDKAVNQLFIQYFEQDNWKNLGDMVSGWKDNPVFKDRFKIITDCVETIKFRSANKINVVNVVLPTLLSQIDGLMTDFLELKGLSWDNKKKTWVDSGTKKNLGRNRNELVEQYIPDVLTPILDDLATDVVLDILFQHSQKGEQLATPFNFNRHKIIHGENNHYGRRDYLIRAFLVMDFLAHISNPN